MGRIAWDGNHRIAWGKGIYMVDRVANHGDGSIHSPIVFTTAVGDEDEHDVLAV